MHRSFRFVLVALSACLLAATATLAAAPADWVGSLEEAQRLSAETGKPIFVVFRCER